jgi:murein hydrolase activator
MMRWLTWILAACLCLSVQADEIRDAESERARAAEALSRLKQDVRLGTKRINLIESEIQKLNTTSKTLTQSIRDAERTLAALREEEQATDAKIEQEQNVLSTLIERYENELVAYYITGRSLKPDAPLEDIRADYLPFLLQARQTKAIEIAARQDTLKELRATQAENSATASQTLLGLTEKRQQLAIKTRDQRQVLASISRELSTKQSREAALNADLAVLEQRIQSLKLDQSGADLGSLKGRLNWPVDGRILRRYGQNRDDGFGTWQGLVISAPDNAEVKSVQSGKVAYAGYLLGYGLVVVLAHNDGHATIYGHNQRLMVQTGDTVRARQVIAIAGNTGSLEVSGVYFGLTRNGKAINPSPWLN